MVTLSQLLLPRQALPTGKVLNFASVVEGFQRYAHRYVQFLDMKPGNIL